MGERVASTRRRGSRWTAAAKDSGMGMPIGRACDGSRQRAGSPAGTFAQHSRPGIRARPTSSADSRPRRRPEAVAHRIDDGGAGHRDHRHRARRLTCIVSIRSSSGCARAVATGWAARPPERSPSGPRAQPLKPSLRSLALKKSNEVLVFGACSAPSAMPRPARKALKSAATFKASSGRHLVETSRMLVPSG